MRVLIAVTHLLGAGHLTRAAALARAFAAHGHDTTLVSGGMPSTLIPREGVTFVQLPPVRTKGADFRTLLDEEGRPVGEERIAARKALLLETLHSAKPDCVITELFPFGRRVLAGEFLTILEEARAMKPRPLIASSIRDILVAPAKPDKLAEFQERLARFYDAVLVHGDESLISLDASWPVDDTLHPLLRYTGYVDDGGEVAAGAQRHGIIVSGGSSAASLPLYRAAVEAAKSIADRPWRILIGHGLDETTFNDIRASAPPHVSVERARPDFRALLAGAEISVSQAGYNTVVDILRTGPSPVFVPFEAGHETEQRLRAEQLKERGQAEIVSEDDLTPQTLATAIRSVLQKAKVAPLTVALDGARESVAQIEKLIPRASATHLRWNWSPVENALRHTRASNIEPLFWWRDDDAVAHTSQLDRLLSLSTRYATGIALASIPGKIEPSFVERVKGEQGVDILVHGLTHRSHAPAGEKKAEFGEHRPLEFMKRDVLEGLRLTRQAFGAKALPVFVPPWNRISPSLVQSLGQLGFRGLSTFRDRTRPEPAPGLLQINTHIDPIDWHGTRSLIEPDALIATLAAAIMRRSQGAADAEEPIGLLTHHLVHDEAVWTFCERLLDHLSRNNVGFVFASTAFWDENGSTLRNGTL
ncbi:glycosyltransferase [Microvirga flavescens]|uniref:glycosyltransferase n=1 Tax=Microvirga flavescens TaxID=2249811 RepID=UPI000DDAA1C2|nr:glycosyltransferase [Microvirga flavescens]